MATVVTLPRLSDTMEEGVIAKWRIAVGDKVKRGQVIAEIETDKATMEFESFDAGVVLKLVAPEGEAMPVGAPIAVFGQQGEDADAALGGGGGAKPAGEKAAGGEKASGDGKAAGGDKASGGGDKAAATAKQAEAALGDRSEGAHGSIAEPSEDDEGEDEPQAAPGPGDRAEAPAAESAESGRVPASPLARRLAREHGLDLTQIRGSGPRGRVVKADIDQAIASGGKPQAPAKTAAQATQPSAAKQAPQVGTPTTEADEHGRPFMSRPDRTIKLSQMRKTIAKRMGQSKREAPHIYLTIPITMDKAAALRSEFNLAVEGTKVSFNDLLILACARALRKHPRVNSYYTETGIVERGDVHIGVAVALDDGLVVPSIRFADQKPLKQVSLETRDLGTRAKAKTLKPEEMTGSTFTISNLGMFGIEEFCAVVNPGESAILAVGAVTDEAVVEDGQVVIRKRMRVTLCSDHRAFDGAESAQFLQTLKKLLETPMSLFA